MSLFSEYYEEILSLMASLTCQAISPPMWEALPLISDVFDVSNGADIFKMQVKKGKAILYPIFKEHN